MKRPSTFLGRHAGLDVKMTPMIDVVFLLLIFFIWTATFRIEYVLPTHLSSLSGSGNDPLDVTAPERDFDPVVIELLWVDDQAIWRINDMVAASLAEVSQVLAGVIQIKRDVPVVIDPSRSVPLGDVIDVYDIARLVGFEKVQFATRE